MAKTKKRGNNNIHQIRTPLEAKTSTQEQYISSLKYGDLTVAIGSAGTGKTYIPSVLFSDMYNDKKIRKLIVTRPTVECGKSLGALPGELNEKFDPWMRNIETIMRKRLSSGKFDCDVKNGNIVLSPLQYMRGLTFDDTAIIVDEAQNLTVEQVKMIITRIGENCKMVLCGDTKQDDLKKEKSGLAWLVKELERQQVTGVDIVRFGIDDCQRSEVCKQMIKMIDRAEN